MDEGRIKLVEGRIKWLKDELNGWRPKVDEGRIKVDEGRIKWLKAEING
ncbi:hypothetical protein P4534_02865 [Peribacillus butanolivorans]|nr:hypothetical protein [Peribacillus butanolivorans]